MNTPIRLLIVDDSIVFREALARGLSHEPLIHILPTASDPYDAIAKIQQYKPNVIVSDIEMPGMNGIEFIKNHVRPMNIPTITLSALHDLKDLSLRAGASAFLAKPKSITNSEVAKFIKELLILVINLGRVQYPGGNLHNQDSAPRDMKGRLIVIGASTGGTEAIHHVLSNLPSNCPPILIVQHIPHGFSRMFAERLNDASPMQVKEAVHGDRLRPGLALVAPGDKHMRLKKHQQHFFVDCRLGEKVNGHTPSVDVLFHSVAETMGAHAIGILLTGMGRDGAEGLLQMRLAGAQTLAQDEESSIVYGMPKAAVDIGAVEKQVSLSRVAQEILLAL
ncbi:chemotaxis-specific protein-glutamate methyltransferase CheB [Paenibacillus endoradicis]|uniref:chemotaxis-specific protein-glutamate methyltransferase CheB n=1 Tax=Paenibacillus endoradicis TaxID=2972487 RepID=UPI002158BF06|nr:chemotaxis-specific protein-glutamate methyltransferase CheB [Paenibacillus endoradicis]MCR8659670.1 chemotaxis-specific protein-glutamate methyltransferase CheB [Paenibacillus endoradicis]